MGSRVKHLFPVKKISIQFGIIWFDRVFAQMKSLLVVLKVKVDDERCQGVFGCIGQLAIKSRLHRLCSSLTKLGRVKLGSIGFLLNGIT